MEQDTNFDSLYDLFKKRIYGSVKGDLRLQLLKEDLNTLQQSPSLKVWDAGCGFAQISQWLAEAGHQIELCDISAKMIETAEQNFKTAGLTANFHNQPAQQFAPTKPSYDLVLCHAVVEWLAAPLPSLEVIAKTTQIGGTFSLLFYNRNAFVYSNALKGQWRWKYLLDGSYLGKGKKLTPPNPQYPHDIKQALQDWGFEITQQTGIRVFNDYLTPDIIKGSDPEELLTLEYNYCRLPTFKDMGRYIHIVAKRLS